MIWKNVFIKLYLFHLSLGWRRVGGIALATIKTQLCYSWSQGITRYTALWNFANTGHCCRWWGGHFQSFANCHLTTGYYTILHNGPLTNRPNLLRINMGYETVGSTHCFNDFPTVSQVLMPQKTPLSSVYVEACKEDEFDEKPLWVNIAGPLLFQKVFTVLYMKFNKLLYENTVVTGVRMMLSLH